MKLKVFHMSGAGNLFSAIDNREYNLTVKELKNLAPVLCKKSEINPYTTEGLISLQNHNGLDFSAEFLNPDGSHGAMCGNGGRCAVDFAHHIGLLNKKSNIKFQMAGDIYSADILSESKISLQFPPPKKVIYDLSLDFNGMKLPVSFVDVGSSHAVIDFKDLQMNDSFREFDIDSIGKYIRFHKVFEPYGVNVNIYSIEDNKINLRTYERGVEAETGACGTGAVSTAIVCSSKHNIQFPIDIIPPSRQELSVDCKLNKDTSIESVYLIGPSIIIDEYEIDITLKADNE